MDRSGTLAVAMVTDAEEVARAQDLSRPTTAGVGVEEATRRPQPVAALEGTLGPITAEVAVEGGVGEEGRWSREGRPCALTLVLYATNK